MRRRSPRRTSSGSAPRSDSARSTRIGFPTLSDFRDFAEARATGPEARGRVRVALPDAELAGIVEGLAGFASAHHDAHLVKYTLACFDAAGTDPAYRRLYLAAAASLSGWWAQHPDEQYAA